MNKLLSLAGIVLFTVNELSAQCPSNCTGTNTFIGNGAGIFNTTGADNVFYGFDAGRNNTTGLKNIFIGFEAGLSNTTEDENTFLGYKSGRKNTTNFNSFFGSNAGAENTSGGSNAFFGAYAGSKNTSGEGNAFFGNSAGRLNISGNENAYFGNFAGQSNTGSNNSFFGNESGVLSTGSNNSFFGHSTGRSNSGSNNNFFGFEAGLNNDGSSNSFFGTNSGTANTSGHDNSFFGNSTGRFNVIGEENAYFGNFAGQNNTGSKNSFFGYQAGALSTGSSNAFFGHSAGRNNTGILNSFFGNNAGANNTSGNFNAFFGGNAGTNNTTGEANSFFGTQSGVANTEGFDNAFFGFESGQSNTEGDGNAFFGRGSGLFNTAGNQNTFIGTNAGLSNTTGGQNVYLGFQAANNNQIGSRNVFLGYQAGFNETGSNKLYISNNDTSTPLIYGDFSDKVAVVNGSLGIGIQNPERPVHMRATNAIFRIDRDRDDPGFAIVRYDNGFNNVWKSFYFYTNADGPNDGKFVIADWGTNVSGLSTARMVIANNGNLGIGNYLFTDPSEKLTVSGNVLATGSFITSDKRFKRNIHTVIDATSRLKELRGVTYQYETQKFSERNLPQGEKIGFIAQEVQKVFPELVTEDSEGYLAVNYDGLIPVLVEALKSQQSRIEALENKLSNNNQENISFQGKQQAQLFQNHPNPFDQDTEIQFFLPENIAQATLFIYDMQGTQIKKIQIQERGKSWVNVKAGSLKAGMYFYSLLADGQEVALKRMMITD